MAAWENPDAKLEDLVPASLTDFPDEVREHVSRIDPCMQPERDAWLREEAGYFVRELEELPARLAEVEAQQGAQCGGIPKKGPRADRA